MFQDSYDHDVIRKFYTYFGALFSNVYIDRESVANNQVLLSRMKVPLHFADVEHALERVLEDPNITKQDAITLPAMSWNFLDMKYNGERHQTSRQRFSVPIANNASSMLVMHAPVPYDFHFQLAVLVKNINDGLKIVEAICPYFTPDLTNKLELIPEMGVIQDIPVVLESCSMDFDVPKEYKERCSFVWIMDFTLQGYLYGPEKTWPLIKFAKAEFFIETGDPTTQNQNSVVLTLTSVPGLTANGQLTDQANLSVNALAVPITSDYGFISTANGA